MPVPTATVCACPMGCYAARGLSSTTQATARFLGQGEAIRRRSGPAKCDTICLIYGVYFTYVTRIPDGKGAVKSDLWPTCCEFFAYNRAPTIRVCIHPSRPKPGRHRPKSHLRAGLFTRPEKWATQSHPREGCASASGEWHCTFRRMRVPYSLSSSGCERGSRCSTRLAAWFCVSLVPIGFGRQAFGGQLARDAAHRHATDAHGEDAMD